VTPPWLQKIMDEYEAKKAAAKVLPSEKPMAGE
jgi:hypothetical protein